MKKDDFDLEILENADNEVIDALNSFPSADEETKRRVFSMSEKKFNDLNNNFEATDENSVKGVETYRRPKWYRTVCVAAAALVLVGGGTATFAALHKTKKSNESMQAASEIETEPTLSDKINSQNSILNEIEMKSIYERLFLPYMDIRRGSDTDRNDPNQEYITFCYYFCDADEYDPSVFHSEDFPYEIKEHDGKMYVVLKYYKINNPKFHTIAGMKEVMGPYINEGSFNYGNYHNAMLGVSEFNFDSYEDGGFIDDFQNFGEIIQYRDQLYTTMYEPDSFDPEKCEITYEKSFPIDSDSFIWESYYRLADDPDTIRRVNVYIENVEDYGWRIFDLSMDQCEYEEFKDYQGGEYPSLMEDIYKEALLNKDSELTSESTKTQESTEENAEPETVEDITEPLTAEPNKAISDYSDEELQNISMLLMNKYVELDHLPDSPYLVPDEIVTFANPTPSNGWPSNDYIRLDDPRFSNLEELVAYYSPYIEESLITFNCDNRNEFKEGDLITEELYPDHLTLPEIIEFNGKLYTYSIGNLYDSVVSCEIKEKNQNGFQVVAQTDCNCILTADIVKTDEDTFRIEKCWWDIT